MTNCWSEGALRAYLDRELPAEDMKSVAAHLGECTSCDALCAELAGRAARVFALIETLPEPELVVRAQPAAARTESRRWLWPGAAVALAAGLAIASFVLPRKEEPAPEPLPVAHLPAPIAPEAPAEVVAPSRAAVVTPIARPAAVRTARRKRPAAPQPDYFLALDDEPIESGVIVRVGVGPDQAQADIVFDPGGRARAVRLVSNKY
jgi:anti-sigma factor RsiW